MAKIRNPVRFSDYFSIEPKQFAIAGVLDPTLNVDTRLFIDPLLLEKSAHAEIREQARTSYEAHFTTTIKLLKASKAVDDVAWRSALKHLAFPEIKGTCLGYGAQSVSGSGSGADMTGHFIRTAKEIVDLGVEDPDLFVALSLLEEGFGPDRISDMTTNVIFGDLLRFNARVLKGLNVPKKALTLRLRNGKSYNAELPVNPYEKRETPIIFVPIDILRDLPIAKDWADVADAASKNSELRHRVNEDIAKLWSAKTLRDKDALRRWAMSGKEPFETLLAMIRGASPEPYDMIGDPLGEIFWRKLSSTLADQEPFIIKSPSQLDRAGIRNIVDQIIEQFRFLIEDRRFSEELYHAGHPRPEKAAQRLFFAVAFAYCKANNLDITPEAETGNGPVDFKVVNGFTGRVLVEIKLSTNRKLVKGYTRQMEAYKTAEQTVDGYYVVIDVGHMGEKDKALLDAKNEAAAWGEHTSPVIFIDGSRKPSASKL